MHFFLKVFQTPVDKIAKKDLFGGPKRKIPVMCPLNRRCREHR